MTASSILPDDNVAGTLVGRVWNPQENGPSVVVVREEGVIDISRVFPTMRDVWECAEPVRHVRSAHGPLLASLDELVRATVDPFGANSLRLLAPIDLQVIKAVGVTFTASLIERVIEERAHGDSSRAAVIREELSDVIGGSLSDLVPGSPAAAQLKNNLKERGWWSQYLEVGIGPDAEVFTKAPVLSAVGAEAQIGVLASSEWNNPEPEIVLAVNSRGSIIGATLGNDVNLRDVEGRSALLLGRAKDNNASAAIGPFIRLFDDTYSLSDLRNAEVRIEVTGTDGFHIEDRSLLARISRPLEDLVSQTMGAHHQYPDGIALYLGTMFAPVQDRHAPGLGFTHDVDDIVEISEPRLGMLRNRVTHAEDAPPWAFGLADLFRNLASRGLLSPADTPATST